MLKAIPVLVSGAPLGVPPAPVTSGGDTDGLRASHLKQHPQGEIPPLAPRKATLGWVRAMCTELGSLGQEEGLPWGPMAQGWEVGVGKGMLQPQWVCGSEWGNGDGDGLGWDGMG